MRITVDGRVQGVGFRFYASRRAESLGVRGQVWNRPDGHVELLAQHESAATLAAFVQALSAGPGIVTAVRTRLETSSPEFSGFTISHPPAA